MHNQLEIPTSCNHRISHILFEPKHTSRSKQQHQRFCFHFPIVQSPGTSVFSPKLLILLSGIPLSDFAKLNNLPQIVEHVQNLLLVPTIGLSSRVFTSSPPWISAIESRILHMRPLASPSVDFFLDSVHFKPQNSCLPSPTLHNNASRLLPTPHTIRHAKRVNPDVRNHLVGRYRRTP